MLESLIRLSVARARVRLGEEITEEDVAEAAQVLVAAQFYDPEGRAFLIEEEEADEEVETEDEDEILLESMRKKTPKRKRRLQESEAHKTM